MGEGVIYHAYARTCHDQRQPVTKFVPSLIHPFQINDIDRDKNFEIVNFTLTTPIWGGLLSPLPIHVSQQLCLSCTVFDM